MVWAWQNPDMRTWYTAPRAVRRAALTLLLLLAVVGFGGFQGPAARAAGNGVIEGHVTNGTPGAPVPAGVGVTLHIVRNDDRIERLQTTTDASGYYRFEGLETSASVKYLPVVAYEQASYFPRVLVLSEQPNQVADITVYEATESDEWIAFERTNLLIQNVTPERIDVMEMGALANIGDRTYVGAATSPGEPRPTLRFPLPPGATNLVPQAGLAPNDVTPTPDGFTISSPVVPGRHQLAFSYSIPAQGGMLVLTKQLAYPALGFSLYVPQIGLRVSSPQLQPQGEAQLGGQTYTVYSAQSLPRGAVLQIQLDGLPTAGADIHRLTWPLLVGGAALLGLGLVVARRRRVQQRSVPAVAAVAPGAADAPYSERVELLLALARLDERYERGELSATEYEAERAAWKQRLVALERQRARVLAGGQ